MLTFKKGIKDGVPIALGYFAVSFAFGVSVVSQGLPALVAVLMSMTNMTSAGQFAGSAVMVVFGTLFEIVLTQVVINARYFLMGITLSQRLSEKFTLKDRLLCSFGITDEIFAVAVTQKQLINKKYFMGLMLLPWAGWSVGTLLGALAGNLLPEILLLSLGIALYGMFIAIVVPAGLADFKIFIVSGISILLSCLFYYLPYLRLNVGEGTAYIICALSASIIGAIFFPVKVSEVQDE
ncbi:MAG: AzlC family ABC transporter permease [Clostridia bacterium]|nr:AzlC family ABC transporter permease [Clostridia bacterium]